MEKFLREYIENLITAIEEGETSLKNVVLDCDYCPLFDKCHAEAENGDDETPCAEYIMKHYA